MTVLRILFTRLRTEEKLLREAAEKQNIPCELMNVSDVWYGEKPFCGTDDVVLARCVSHNQNEAVAQILESQGITVVNSSSVMAVCGNKLSTSIALAGRNKRPVSDSIHPEAALEARGSRLSCRMQTGKRQLGRLAKINDREAEVAPSINRCWVSCTTILHPEFIEKGDCDAGHSSDRSHLCDHKAERPLTTNTGADLFRTFL